MLASLPAAVAQTATVPSRDAVLAVVTREASAEMTRQKALNAHTRRAHHTVSGVFLVAALRLDAPDVRDYAVEAAGTGTLALGDMDERLYARTGEAETLAPLRQKLDATLADLTEMAKRPAWDCDAVVLAPAVYARMSVLTNDPKYIQAMDRAWGRAGEGYACNGHGKAMNLSDEAAVIAGLARVLEVMPADFPSRPHYVDQYQGLAAQLIAQQGSDGRWRTPAATAQIAYALAFGLNHDLLDRQTYLPPVLGAWAGLNRDIGPDGLLSGTADASGAFILAGLEIAKFNDPATPLPSPVIVQAADAMPPRTERPAGLFDPSTPRREAQARPASPAVATDPATDDPSERSPIPRLSLPASSK